jgi:DNA-binding SARP family transcriptional activator
MLLYRGQATGGSAVRPDRETKPANAMRPGMRTHGPLRAAPEARPEINGTDLLAQAPFGLLVFDGDGSLIGDNPASEQMLGPFLRLPGGAPPRCCDLLGCRRPGSALEGHCILELAAGTDGPLPEVRIDIGPQDHPGALWIAVAPLEGDQVMVTLRPGQHGDRRRRTNPHWISGPRLTVGVLGRTSLASAETPLPGQWLQQRAGQVFKYLVVNRNRFVPIDELAETFWPAGADSALRNVRYFIHVVRDRLEPEREKRAPSTFVVAESGGYRLDTSRIEIDADVFESLASAGLTAASRGQHDAHGFLKRATELYGDHFMADEPYAEWTLAERDRLRALTAESLRALTLMAANAHDLEEAAEHLGRLAELEPFDVQVQREMLALQIHRGRHSEARRRYFALRVRMREHFGQELDFTLSDVVEHTGGRVPLAPGR